MTINTHLNLVDFIAVTEELVEGNFDVNGDYAPHYGLVNAMRVFYNVCVTASKFDDLIPHGFDNIMLVDDLEKDDEFCKAFKEACLLGSYDERFTFAVAYEKANEIVETRRKSVLYSVSTILDTISGRINEVISNVDIKEFRELMDKMKAEGIDANAIWEAYVHSTAFVGKDKSEQTDDNIVQLKAGDQT